MKKAILLMGIPGSGKSTYAKNFTGFWNLERDKERETLGSRQNFTNENVITEVIDAKLARAARCGKDVLVSDTNLNSSFRNVLIEKLQGLGFSVEIHVLNTPKITCLFRNSLRPDGERVPEKVIQDMHDNMWKQLVDEGWETSLGLTFTVNGESIPVKFIN